MNVEYHHWWSEHLSQEMELKVYGHAGKPVLVFPAQCGRFYEYEELGMISAASWFIEQGLYQLYTVDSLDAQTWADYGGNPHDRARRHEDYDRYITREVVPFVRGRTSPETCLLATGVSMGAYHAGNFFFRHPDLFDSLISLSGVFSLRLFVGEAMDENIYFNSPLDYLANLEDAWYLEKYRRSQIIICAGQGAWEEQMLADIRALRAILEQKNIPAWIDLWGTDVVHDWPWWRLQLPYFLSKLLEAG